MTIIHSAEVRWVIPGVVPENIKNWFKSDPNCRKEKTRIDYYLKFFGDQCIGIKLRKYASGDQKLELKPVLKNNINVKLPDGISGRVEQWEKRSTGAIAGKELLETNPEGGKPFWTLGFETFNDEDIVVNVLAEVVRMEILENQCPSEIYDYLTSETTDSYPSWFAKFR